MPQKQFAPATPDLFGAVQSPVRRRTGRVRSSSGSSWFPPKLHSFSDRELALLLSELVDELHRRLDGAAGRQPAPELERALQNAASAFVTAGLEEPKRSRDRTERGRREIPETKRKAIRSALLAGAKPTQVAKHFGVPLSTLRQIGSTRE